MKQSAPPILRRDGIDDVGDVVRLLERNAPCTPPGGWYRPGAELDVPDSPPWGRSALPRRDRLDSPM